MRGTVKKMSKGYVLRFHQNRFYVFKFFLDFFLSFSTVVKVKIRFIRSQHTLAQAGSVSGDFARMSKKSNGIIIRLR